MDWEAQDDGFVAKILAEEGSKDVSVGSPVIVIVEEEVRSLLKPLDSLMTKAGWQAYSQYAPQVARWKLS